MVGSLPESASYAGGLPGGCIRVRRSSSVGTEVARAAKIVSDKRRILVRQAASRLPHAIACRSVNSETHALRGLAQTSCPGVGWCVRCAWLFSRHYRRKYETSLATCSPGVLGANARQGWPSAASTASLGRRALLNPIIVQAYGQRRSQITRKWRQSQQFGGGVSIDWPNLPVLFRESPARASRGRPSGPPSREPCRRVGQSGLPAWCYRQFFPHGFKPA